MYSRLPEMRLALNHLSSSWIHSHALAKAELACFFLSEIDLTHEKNLSMAKRQSI